MLIDSSYFQFALRVPKETASQQAILANYIIRFEKQILIDALGTELYDEFIAGLAQPAPLQKWLDLRDGANFIVEDYDGNNRTIKWNGLINPEKVSLIAYFVYYNILIDSVVNFGTGGGVYSDDSENKAKIPTRTILIARYNEGLKLYGFAPWNYEKEVVTINDTVNHYIEHYNWMLSPSLYNFIYYANKADATTYPNWIFSTKRRLNNLGI